MNTRRPPGPRVFGGHAVQQYIALFLACTTIAAAAMQLGCTSPYGAGQNRVGSMPARAGVAPPGAGAGPRAWIQLPLGPSSSVGLPWRPTDEQETRRLSDGSRITIRRYTLQFYQSNFLVLTTDFEGGVGGDPVELLGVIQDGFLDSAEGMDVVASDAIWRQGHPGTAVELRNDAGRRIVVEHFVGRSRAYSFAFGSPSGASAQFVATERAFFESIRFDPNDAPSPAGDGRLDYARFQWIYPPEGGFAAEMPGTATRTTTSERFGNEDYETFVYETHSDDGRSVMRVRTIDIDAEEAPADLLRLLQAQVTREGGVVRGVRPAQRQGFGGQAFIVDATTTVRYVLQIITPARVYEMVHVMPRGDEASQAENRRRFLNSLRIL